MSGTRDTSHSPAPRRMATEKASSFSNLVKVSDSIFAAALSTAFFLEGRLIVTVRIGQCVWHIFIK